LVADLFNQAVGQLRDEKLDIRLFAIYASRLIVDGYPDCRRAVIELLSAYVRQQQPSAAIEAELPVDVREILRIISQPVE
jgi:hypothetical protein